MDKRARTAKVCREEDIEKKAITKGIINDIKDKIDEIKQQKEMERCNRKNELDFEINQDFMNQFKKNKGKEKGTSSNDADMRLSTPDGINKGMRNEHYIKYKGSDLKRDNSIDLTNNQPIQLHQREGNNKKYEMNRNGNTNNSVNANATTQNGNNANNGNSFFILKSKTNQTSLSRSGNNKSDLGRTNSFDFDKKQLFESRKDDAKGFLNPSSSIKHPKEESSSLLQLPLQKPSPSLKQTKNVSGTTREKIKNFFNEIDDNKKNKPSLSQLQVNKSIKMPVYDFASNEKKYESCFTQANLTKVIDKAPTLKSYFDFNNNPSRDKKGGLNLEPMNSLSSNNILSNHISTTPLAGSQRNKIDLTSIQLSEITAISNKIRFCSNEEMKNMDKGLINELLNLSVVIQKTIVPKLKAKELNCL